MAFVILAFVATATFVAKTVAEEKGSFNAFDDSSCDKPSCSEFRRADQASPSFLHEGLRAATTEWAQWHSRRGGGRRWLARDLRQLSSGSSLFLLTLDA